MNEVGGTRLELRGVRREVQVSRRKFRMLSISSKILNLNLNLILNLSLILILILILILNSCKQANPRTVKLWVEMSDTMVQRMIKEQQPALDSLCLTKTDSLFRLAFDSIYSKRLTEIRKLIDSSRYDEIPIR